MLNKLMVGAALKAEFGHHLSYDKSDPAGHYSVNARNGFFS
jgi:transposase-like protein